MQPCPGSVVYLYDTFLRKHVYRLCSIYMIPTCRLYFYPELHSTPAIVCTVRIRWSSWCNCGRHSKIVHMTGLCTFGGAQKSVAKGCLGGMPPIQNKLTVIKNQKNTPISVQRQGVARTALQRRLCQKDRAQRRKDATT